MADTEAVLNYLSEWRSSRQIREKFDLSNTSFYRLLRWFKKAKLVEVYSCTGVEKHKTNRTFLYKKITTEAKENGHIERK